MRNRRICIAGLVFALALVAFAAPRSVFSEVERDATGAVGSDASQITRDQREILEFKATLAAMDDALMRNHLENYYTLNNRLRQMMERELEQSRQRLRDAEELRKQQRSAQRMRATMGASGVDFLDLEQDPIQIDGGHLDIASAKKRGNEMEKLIQRFGALQLSVQEEDTRAYARNAAVLDKFLQLMRAEDAAVMDLSSAKD